MSAKGLDYLYAVADASGSRAIEAAGLAGIDGGVVRPVTEGRLVGAASVVGADDFDEAPLNQHLQDLDWLAPRAAAHQDVNARLLDLLGAIVPLSFGAIFRGPDGIRRLLRERADDLVGRLGSVAGRAEWIVSVEREDMPSDEPALRELESAIAEATPGRAFLLSKRRDEVAREAERARRAEIAEEAARALESAAERVYREPLIDDAGGSAVARFSVLVDRAREAALREAVARIGVGTGGCRARLSGPWPAYRFAGLSDVRSRS